MKLFRKRKKAENVEIRENVIAEEMPEGGDQPGNRMLDECEQMIEAAKALEDTKSEYKVVTSYLNDIQLLEDMSEEEMAEIRQAAENVVALGNTRTEYMKTEKKINDAQFGQMQREEDGATHQCLEDLALMREIPGMVVINPSDDVEARAAVKAAYEHVGPVYLRFGRLALPVINDTPDYKFEIGKGIVLKEGTDVTVFATGLCVSSALEAAEMLEKDGISAKVVNIHTIKPLDEELVVKAAKETGKVVTVEEHSVIGGLGSAVCEVLSEKAPTKVLRVGIQDVFGESGPAVELVHKYGLDAEGVYGKIKTFVKEN